MKFEIVKTLQVTFRGVEYRTVDLENWEERMGMSWAATHPEFYPNHPLHEVMENIPHEIKEKLRT